MHVRYYGSRALVITGMGALIVTTGGLGVAAASGGLALGHTNASSSTTTIKDKNGTPLSLSGPSSKAPLKVSSSHLVSKLNAQYLGGSTSRDLTAASNVLASMSEGTGIALCPSGTHPVGGGVVPDVTGLAAGDLPYIVADSAHISSRHRADGWEGIVTNADGAYDGAGFVYAACAPGGPTTFTSSAKGVMRAESRIRKATR